MVACEGLGELFVDNFCGGGGVSTGIEKAIKRPVDIAVNHSEDAIRMHRTNHPGTTHYCESVWTVDPMKVCNGKPVALAWFSPDCTHFSRAKGGKPLDKQIRALAWVVVKWARRVRPRVIVLENVVEFVTWGPLKDGAPIPDRAGETFREWKQNLIDLGYDLEYRELAACDFGAPTNRRRLFVIARCDGNPIVWPMPTHGKPDSAKVASGLLQSWIPASEVIDWSIPCPSIFDSSKEIFDLYGVNARRPLKDATMKRIARGVRKFVLETPNPFLVRRGDVFTAESLIQYHGDKTGSSSVRGQNVTEPLLTVDTANRYGLVTAFLAKHYGGSYTGPGIALTNPTSTITAIDHHALITANLMEQKAVMDLKNAYCVYGFLAKHYGQGIGHSLREPLHTIMANNKIALVYVYGSPYVIVDIGMRMLTPRELYLAMGFPDSYIIDKDDLGISYTKKAQVARCGNAVPPPLAEAITRANLPEYCQQYDIDYNFIPAVA